MTKQEALNTRQYLINYLSATKANIDIAIDIYDIFEENFAHIEDLCDSFEEAKYCLKWVERQIPKRELRHLRAKERTASRKREREAKSFLRDLTLVEYELVTE